MALKPLQPHEVDEIASDAQALTTNKAWQRAFAELEERYITALKNTNIGDLTVPTLHASMRVLEDVKGQVQTYITEAKFRNRR